MFAGTDLAEAYTLPDVGGAPSASPSRFQSQDSQQHQHEASRAPTYDASLFDKQLREEQLQKQMMMQQSSPTTQVVYHQPQPIYAPSYVERMMRKRKDVIKMFSIALIILLALSIHNLVKSAMKHVIKQYDLPKTKQLMLRLGYPLVVLFFMWNQRVFMSAK